MPPQLFGADLKPIDAVVRNLKVVRGQSNTCLQAIVTERGTALVLEN